MDIKDGIDADSAPAPWGRLAPWRRSTRCESGDCAEVQQLGHMVRFRNSTQADVMLAFSRDQWTTFTAAIRRGDFDVQR